MFQFGGLGALFEGLRPPKPPVATGLNCCYQKGEFKYLLLVQLVLPSLM